MDVAKDYGKDLAVGAGAGALAGVIISPLAEEISVKVLLLQQQ